ncbi:Phage-associated protein [Streptococcus sp. DD10]|uniref:hypothetical protein n=1 Tax=Streptococcus sp. DD10 TaxID=1777878 RepID=UPI00079AE283|nr:hypothetical protein [Streptococcus sp. DD10]KXT73195.1 Phage-associated protein [Streptococcus sp. DD10]
MSNLKFKLNRAGVAELMKSGAMITVLNKHATAIKNRCGDGYEQDLYVGKSRANVSVSAKTYKAKKDNLKNNTLLKAVR